MSILKDTIEFIFSIALFINALLFIPQAFRIIKERSAAGVSLVTFGGFLLIQLTVVLHAIIEADELLLFGYLFSMLTCGAVVILTLIYRK
jgi:MtN3 and saliva related transmembrane protein